MASSLKGIMKIKVNDVELFTLSEIQKKVICNDISEELLEDDLKRRLQWALIHKYENCFERLKKEWDVKLQSRVSAIPTDRDQYARLVFSQPDYQDKKQKDMKIA